MRDKVKERTWGEINNTKNHFKNTDKSILLQSFNMYTIF